jgi:hypothetical protein
MSKSDKDYSSNYTRQTRAITAIIPLVKLVVLLNNTTRQTRGIIPVISLLAIRLLYIIRSCQLVRSGAGCG